MKSIHISRLANRSGITLTCWLLAASAACPLWTVFAQAAAGTKMDAKPDLQLTVDRLAPDRRTAEQLANSFDAGVLSRVLLAGVGNQVAVDLKGGG